MDSDNQQNNTQQPAPKQNPLLDAFKLYLAKWNVADGRANRAEYWWAFLDVWALSYAINWVLGMMGTTGLYLSSLVALAFAVPGIFLAIRRLHDIGKSGLFLLWLLLPVIGWIMVLIPLIKPSDPGANAYGEPSQF